MSDKSAHNLEVAPGNTDPQIPNADPLLTTREAAAYLNVSKSYLDKLRVYGGGPDFIQYSKRVIRYRQSSSLDLWVQERSFGSTSEY